MPAPHSRAPGHAANAAGDRSSAAAARALASWRHARRQLIRRNADQAAVHQLRVCSRRLFALEALLSATATGPRSDALRSLLHDCFHAAGRVRDVQLAIDRLRELAGRYPAAARLARHLHRGLGRRRVRLVQRVRAVRPRQVRAILAAWDTHCPRQRAALRLARAQRLLRRAQAGRSARSLHRYRIRLKLLRYMREFSREAGLQGNGAPAQIRGMASLQRRLGRITDIQVLLRMIDRFGARHPAWRRDAAPLRRHLQRQQRVLLDSRGTGAAPASA